MSVPQLHHAVTLSVLAPSQLNKAWPCITDMNPGDILALLEERESLKTQGYIAAVYSSDPRETASEIINRSVTQSVSIISYWCDAYPSLLKEIHKPPLVLYVKGDLPEGRRVSIVGTRRADSLSREVARRIAALSVMAGAAVVSGMALGIDREAHLGALEGGGRTIGVLANGIGITYPRGNDDLFRMIEESEGASFVSEYPPGIRADKWTFVRRNRIISGLSHGTVVVQGGYRSGALITARYALEQNREVFACPGPVLDESYLGCHRLIQKGAFLVAEPADVVRELFNIEVEGDSKADVFDSISSADSFLDDRSYPPDTLEGKILGFLARGSSPIDSLIRSVGEPPGTVHTSMMDLEFQGRIIRSGNRVARKR